MEIEFDRIDSFKIEDYSFGDLKESTLISLFRDGRISSRFLEVKLPIWYPDLVFVDKKGYDHIDKQHNKYDQKTFTVNGLKFAPSSMIGAGRKIIPLIADKHINSINFICCDVVDFPKIRVVFKHGDELLNTYTSYTVPFNNRTRLFNDRTLF